jgi:hypothetical protein
VQVLTSCELVSEGLDIPAVTGAILCRPTKSLAVYLQQVGRAMRPKAHKAVILDHAGCVLAHGLPDTPRDWRLDQPKRKPAERSTVKVCKACFATVPINCKRVSRVRRAVSAGRAEGAAAHEVGELVEIREWQHVERSRAGIAAAVAQCRTWRELKALGKHLGLRQRLGFSRGARAGLAARSSTAWATRSGSCRRGRATGRGDLSTAIPPRQQESKPPPGRQPRDSR